MKLLVLLAKGFETMEFSPFIDVFGWARGECGLTIEVETCGFALVVPSTFGIPVMVDKLVEDIDPGEYCALAIPGGFEEYGFYEEAYSEPFLELIRAFHLEGKPIATVCVAALPLGKSGVLKGRRATTYRLNGRQRQKQLAEFGVKVVNSPVVTDGNLITSYGPRTAPHVAFALLEQLVNRQQADTVRYAMGWQPSPYPKS